MLKIFDARSRIVAPAIMTDASSSAAAAVTATHSQREPQVFECVIVIRYTNHHDQFLSSCYLQVDRRVYQSFTPSAVTPENSSQVAIMLLNNGVDVPIKDPQALADCRDSIQSCFPGLELEVLDEPLNKTAKRLPTEFDWNRFSKIKFAPHLLIAWPMKIREKEASKVFTKVMDGVGLFKLE